LSRSPRSKRFDTNAAANCVLVPSSSRASVGSPAKLSMNFLVVEDLVADLLSAVDRYSSLTALEALGVDPVGDPLGLDRGLLDLLHQPAGVGPGALERARLHHDHDVLQLAEILDVVPVADHVARVLRQEGAGRRLEGQRVQPTPKSREKATVRPGRRHDARTSRRSGRPVVEMALMLW